MNIASYIDHTILKAETTLADVEKLCLEAVGANFKAVCIPPNYVSAAKNFLTDSGVKTATVIGFPFGYSVTTAKLAEMEQALRDGADELDVVINIAEVKNGNWVYLENEVNSSAELIHSHGKVMKLIVESGILTGEELKKCCVLVNKYKVDFIKTSTGYAASGAAVDAVKTMRSLLPETIEIKASGGIRSFAFAKELIEAGATRIGCSASLQILEESRTRN
jgi:deoxyribose-phosphate aldolase